MRAFLDLDVRQLRRTRYPRGLVVNAAVTGTGLALLGLLGDGQGPTTLVVVFAVSIVAVSVGQFAVPFASGHYDRLLTLPGAVPAFVRAKLLLVVGGVGLVGGFQLVLALAVAALGATDAVEAAVALGVGALFSAGVMAPVAVYASTLGPEAPRHGRPRDDELQGAVVPGPGRHRRGRDGGGRPGPGPRRRRPAPRSALAGGLGLALAMPLWERAVVRRPSGTRATTVATRSRTTL